MNHPSTRSIICFDLLRTPSSIFGTRASTSAVRHVICMDVKSDVPWGLWSVIFLRLATFPVLAISSVAISAQSVCSLRTKWMILITRTGCIETMKTTKQQPRHGRLRNLRKNGRSALISMECASLNRLGSHTGIPPNLWSLTLYTASIYELVNDMSGMSSEWMYLIPTVLALALTERACQQIRLWTQREKLCRQDHHSS